MTLGSLFLPFYIAAALAYTALSWAAVTLGCEIPFQIVVVCIALSRSPFSLLAIFPPSCHGLRLAVAVSCFIVPGSSFRLWVFLLGVFVVWFTARSSSCGLRHVGYKACLDPILSVDATMSGIFCASCMLLLCMEVSSPGFVFACVSGLGTLCATTPSVRFPSNFCDCGHLDSTSGFVLLGKCLRSPHIYNRLNSLSSILLGIFLVTPPFSCLASLLQRAVSYAWLWHFMFQRAGVAVSAVGCLFAFFVFWCGSSPGKSHEVRFSSLCWLHGSFCSIHRMRPHLISGRPGWVLKVRDVLVLRVCISCARSFLILTVKHNSRF